MRTIASSAASVNTTRDSLLSANARLLALRTERQETQGRIALPAEEGSQQIDGDVVVPDSAAPPPTPTKPTGWLSSLHEGVSTPLSNASAEADPDELTSPPAPTDVTTFGTIAAAILKHDGGTVGRLWLLLRAHFAGERQSGMISAAELWHCLNTAFPQYSQRHLRDLLNRGEGIYWQRDAQNRLWLTGATKVADNLDIERLQGVRVVIPLADLTGKLTRMRTALQAAFHASRESENPISRATLRDLTGVSERSQREQEVENYDLITAKANYSLDCFANAVTRHEHAFRYRHGAFTFTDYLGKQGRAGATYLAHQMPNTYTARYTTASRGRKRKINRLLSANRVVQGARGTGWQQVDTVFCTDGSHAVQEFNRNTEEVAFPIDTLRHGKRIWQTL